MAAIDDVSIGFGVESTYGTAVTPTRWLEFTDESLTYTPNKVQGEGMRAGSYVARSNKRVTTTYDGGGVVTHETISKGMGLLLQAAFGTGASTLVSASTYQQVFTLGTSPAPLTIQKGVVAGDSSGTVQPYTFAGCMCRSVEFTLDNAGLLKAAFDWDARSMVTATAYTAPSYAVGGSLFHFAQGAVVLGGTVTAPTTTALASGGTAVANVRDFSFKLDNGMGDSRYLIGGAGLKGSAAPRGLRSGTGKLTLELTDTVARDAILADTELALMLTFTSTEVLSTGFATLQIVLPAVKLDGEMPKATGVLPTIEATYTMLDNLTAAQPVWGVLRTADTAL